MPTFEHMRVSLARPSQVSLFEKLGEEPLSRTEYLRRAFSVRRDFLYRKRKYIFDPMPAPEGFLAGFFSRESVLHGRSGPDNRYALEEHPNWELALFVIDLAKDSQIAGVQFNRKVGSPKPLLETFMENISRLPEFADYKPHVLYVSNEDSYWKAVDKYYGRITSITFTFIPPNAFESKKKVAEFLQEAASASNSDTSKHIYESKSGSINPRAELLEASAEVAIEGGGSATVKAEGRTVYTSAKARKETEVDGALLPTPNEPDSLWSVIRRLFGKQQ